MNGLWPRFQQISLYRWQSKKMAYNLSKFFVSGSVGLFPNHLTRNRSSPKLSTVFNDKNGDNYVKGHFAAKYFPEYFEIIWFAVQVYRSSVCSCVSAFDSVCRSGWRGSSCPVVFVMMRSVFYIGGSCFDFAFHALRIVWRGLMFYNP